MDQRPGGRRGRGGRGWGSLVRPAQVLRFLGLATFPAVGVDHRFHDGDTVRVGPIVLTANITAGHTRGCTSWSFPVRDGDRELLAVDICSLTLMPLVSLQTPETYPGIREDYEQSFRTLRSLPADLFLASHTGWFGLERKLAAQAGVEDPAAPFIDRKGYLAFIDRAEARFRQALEH